MSAHALSPPDSRPAAAATARSVLARRMAFVTGKGGVGKTTVSAALALAAVADRRPAVVCEPGTRAQLPRAFGRTIPGPGAEVELAPGLTAISIDPDAALAEWMARNIGRPGAALLARSDAFRYFVAAAPGARELVGIGKAWDLTRSRGASRAAGSSSSTRPPAATRWACCKLRARSAGWAGRGRSAIRRPGSATSSPTRRAARSCWSAPRPRCR